MEKPTKEKCKVCKGTRKIVVDKPNGMSITMCPHCNPPKGKLICC